MTRGSIRAYDEPGVRRQVRAQLAAMRSAGIETLWLILWHMTLVGSHRWGVVSSAGGGSRSRSDRTSSATSATCALQGSTVDRVVCPNVDELPLRTAAIRLRARKAGGELELHPRCECALEGSRTSIDESRLDQRRSSERFHPSGTTARDTPIHLRAHRRYVRAYGNEDILVSAIAQGDPSRLRQLVEILLGTGEQLPRWFEIHPSYSAAEALRDLRVADAATNVERPLATVRDRRGSSTDDGPVAQAIAEFMRTSARPVSEVIQWPLTADRRCENISVSAPYRAERLHHRVDRQGRATAQPPSRCPSSRYPRWLAPSARARRSH